MKTILKSIMVTVGCTGGMRFATYKRFGTSLLRITGGTEA